MRHIRSCYLAKRINSWRIRQGVSILYCNFSNHISQKWMLMRWMPFSALWISFIANLVEFPSRLLKFLIKWKKWKTSSYLGHEWCCNQCDENAISDIDEALLIKNNWIFFKNTNQRGSYENCGTAWRESQRDVLWCRLSFMWYILL